MTLTRWLASGAALSPLAVLSLLALGWLAPQQIDQPLISQDFLLLGSVAVPHLLLSRWLEARLDR